MTCHDIAALFEKRSSTHDNGQQLMDAYDFEEAMREALSPYQCDCYLCNYTREKRNK
jgi:hypothetical protein